MAPFNLENNIREKLENRELKPSPDAWKKLEAQLKTAQPKRKVGRWYYVAASVVGLFIAVSVFFNNNTAEVKNQIVNQEIQQIEKVQNEVEVVSEKEESLPGENVKSKAESSKETNIKQTSKPIPTSKPSEIDKKIKKSGMLADQATEVEAIDSIILPDPEVIQQDKIFNAKVDEVVASVKFLQKRNDEITADEVETLLNNARRDIQTQRILSNPKVNATALLQEVEWELERNFRDKVFDALGEGFEKLRTTISFGND